MQKKKDLCLLILLTHDIGACDPFPIGKMRQPACFIVKGV